jgi:hypothetical protein
MKHLPLLITLLFSTAALSNTPECEFGALTDPDGDGWGWEDGLSCRVVDAPATDDEEQTTNTDGCDYTSAGSNGGWGWNSATGESCPPQSATGAEDELTNLPDSGTTMSQLAAMQALIIGGWDCTRRFPHYNQSELRQTHNSTEGGWTFGAITNWYEYAHIVCSHLNGNCGRGSQSLFWHSWTLDFQANGQVLIDRNEGNTSYWVGRTLHNWQLSEANAQLVISPEPDVPLWGDFSEIGFEWFNGERYMHLYPTEADSPRLSCKARS